MYSVDIHDLMLDEAPSRKLRPVAQELPDAMSMFTELACTGMRARGCHFKLGIDKRITFTCLRLAPALTFALGLNANY